jgi:hypothetical protein
MRALLLIGLLLSGCGVSQPLVAAPDARSDARFVLERSDAPASDERIAQAPRAQKALANDEQGSAAPQPRSGLWRFTWQMGENRSVTRELNLSFGTDGAIKVDDREPGFYVGAPNRLDGGKVDFDGDCGAMLPNRTNGYSCDRYRLTVVSSREMKGEVSVLVNFRWLALPATAVLLEPSSGQKF